MGRPRRRQPLVAILAGQLDHRPGGGIRAQPAAQPPNPGRAQPFQPVAFAQRLGRRPRLQPILEAPAGGELSGPHLNPAPDPGRLERLADAIDLREVARHAAGQAQVLAQLRHHPGRRAHRAPAHELRVGAHRHHHRHRLPVRHLRSQRHAVEPPPQGVVHGLVDHRQRRHAHLQREAPGQLGRQSLVDVKSGHGSLLSPRPAPGARAPPDCTGACGCRAAAG